MCRNTIAKYLSNKAQRNHQEEEDAFIVTKQLNHVEEDTTSTCSTTTSSTIASSMIQYACAVKDHLTCRNRFRNIKEHKIHGKSDNHSEKVDRIELQVIDDGNSIQCLCFGNERPQSGDEAEGNFDEKIEIIWIKSPIKKIPSFRKHECDANIAIKGVEQMDDTILLKSKKKTVTRKKKKKKKKTTVFVGEDEINANVVLKSKHKLSKTNDNNVNMKKELQEQKELRNMAWSSHCRNRLHSHRRRRRHRR